MGSANHKEPGDRSKSENDIDFERVVVDEGYRRRVIDLLNAIEGTTAQAPSGLDRSLKEE